MGTGFDLNATQEEVGIIPRAVEHLFNGIDQRRQAAFDNNEPAPEFKVNAQFMEVRTGFHGRPVSNTLVLVHVQRSQMY